MRKAGIWTRLRRGRLRLDFLRHRLKRPLKESGNATLIPAFRFAECLASGPI